MAKVPPLHGNIDFNAQHCPMGAFTSFTLGKFGSRGGLAAELGKPANQDVYIGIKEGDRFSTKPLKCLPFYEGATKDAAAAFLVEQAPAAPTHQSPLSPTPPNKSSATTAGAPTPGGPRT